MQLLSPRPRDKSRAGFVNWPLMSVGTWGESPNGFWRATVEDEVNIEPHNVLHQYNMEKRRILFYCGCPRVMDIFIIIGLL